MRSNQNLYSLIHSLTSTEKGYFRKFAKRHIIGKKNIYLRLFEEVNNIKSTEKYDEHAVKEKVRKYSRIGNFSVLKSYLYDMILKSMRIYNSGHNQSVIINDYLEDSSFFLKKNMLTESLGSVNKARKIAIKLENYSKLLDINRRERTLLKSYDPANTEKFENLNSELQEITDKIKNRSEYIKLNDIAVSLTHKYGITDTAELKKRFEKILASEYLTDEKNAQTFTSQLYFYQIFANYHYFMNNSEEALSCFKKIVELYENDRLRRTENPGGYILMLQNCIDICYQMNRLEDYDYYLIKFRDITNDKSIILPEHQKLFVLSRSYIYELRKYTILGDFDEHSSGFKLLRGRIEQKLNLFPDDEKIILIYLFAIYYFGCGNFNESLKWLNIIINKEEEIRMDLRLECRLLFLIIHYELGNYDLLEYAVKSTYRYLRKRKTLMGIEPVILYFIRKIGAVSGDDELIQLFIELKDKMLPHKETLKQFGFNYIAWVESKIYNISYVQVIKKYYSAGSESSKKVPEYD